ncbi:hypothetical protein KCP76_00565 [Salmonella enterica subsp. enterica serovar Weltevreden]|nr:hypothetical protein KCP76_00565 [Salmonella enterica subsp. enterica serovar Weltevreden]
MLTGDPTGTLLPKAAKLLNGICCKPAVVARLSLYEQLPPDSRALEIRISICSAVW